MNSIRKILLILLFGVTLNATSFKDTTTFQANFTQIIQNPSGTKVSYSGILHIKDSNLIRWQYTKPIEKFVYIKNNTITIIEPELEQAIITKLDKEINILKLLKTASKISDNHYLSKFNKVDYKITIKNNILQQIAYQDELENNVTISFTDAKQNKTIDNDIFKFSIPYEFDIIKK